MNDDDRDPDLKTIADRIGALIKIETTVSPDPVTVFVVVKRGDCFETVMAGNSEKPDYDALADAFSEICWNWLERGLIDIDADDETATPANRPVQ